jgi:peroxiredoxin
MKDTKSKAMLPYKILLFASLIHLVPLFAAAQASNAQTSNSQASKAQTLNPQPPNPQTPTARAPNFFITGKIGNMDKPARAYLDYSDGNGGGGVDSSELVNGVFSFSGYTAGISTARMSLDHTGEGKQAAIYKGGDNIYFYFANDHMAIRSADSMINAQVTGSEIFDGYVAYNKAIGGSIMQIDRIVNAEFAAGTPEQQKDSNFMKVVNDDFRRRINLMKKNQIQFAKDHPDSFFGLVALSEAGAINKANVDAADSIFNAINLKWRDTNFGKALAQRIEAARLVVPGEPAPLFTLADANGQPLSLADLKGKVVLLDFWASWCEPCRAESPNLKTQYQLYKDKGLQIISVSLDTDKKNWLKAISDDGLTWLQVSDLKGYNSEVVRSYGISGVPSFFLIGRDGKILANANLQGAALNQRLAEIFGH